MEFETIEHQHGQPYKLFLVSIGQRTPHFHRDLEIIHVLKGRIRIHIGNMQTIVNAGELFLINPFEIHSIMDITEKKDASEQVSENEVSSESNLLLIIQIASQAFENNAFELSQIRFSKNDLTSELKWVAPLMTNLYWKGFDSDTASDFLRLGTLYTLVGKLLESCPYEIGSSNPSKTKEDAFKRILTLIEHVEAHFDEPIVFESLADSLHISKFHLSHSVKQTMGISFQTYLNTVRMTKAVQLIYNTKLTILEISERSGFSDQKYLNQMVQKHYGCSASALRKRAKEADNPMPAAPIGSIHLPFDLTFAHHLLSSESCINN